MFSRRIITMATTVIGTGAVGFAAIGVAGTAAASAVQTADAAFLSQMQRLGVSFPTTQAAVQAGHQVCTDLAAGQTPTAVAVGIFRHTSLTPPQAASVVMAATKAYCPQFSGQPA